MVKTSVIIVNHNHNKDSLECINSILNSKVNFKYEIIVVDNSDKTDLKERLIRKYKTVKYIESQNYGYGAGNNLGARYVNGKYILILNPDCRVSSNTIKVLSDFLDDHPDAGAISPNVTDINGKLYPHIGSRELTPIRGIFALSFLNKLFPKNPISKKYFMEDRSLNEIREADTIPGASFMIRKDVFNKINGFDEKMFMYFEESDMGKKIKKEGLKLYITPKTKVKHKWDVDNTNAKLQKIFDKSRFYYFKKHYGLLNAILVEAFCRISKYNILLLLIFALGIFLRFYKADQLFILDSEIADNLLNIKNFYFNRQIPLIGPPTSHPWLYFGPLFYWLYGPVLILSNFEAISHLYFGLLVGGMVILVNYIFVNKYWDNKTALISSLLLSVSPILLIFSNNVRFYTYTVLLIYPFLYFLFEWLKGKRKIFWVFFSLGIMLSFHYSVLVLIPAIFFLIFLNKIKINIKLLAESAAGLLLPVIPLFIYDSKYNFEMIKNMILWFPYRILLALGVIHKEVAESTSILLGLKQFSDYFLNIFIFNKSQLLFLIAIFLFILVIKYFKNIKSSNIYSNTLLVIFIISAALLMIHGNTPIHYFLFLTPIIIILFSDILINYFNKRYLRFITASIIFISLFNIYTYLNSKNQAYEKIYSDSGYLYYSNQIKIVQYLISDARGESLAIKRIGENDQFPGDFAQNYQYLLWYKGNEPVMVGDQVIKNIKPKYLYTIIEAPYNFDGLDYSEKFNFEGVTVLKSNYEK